MHELDNSQRRLKRLRSESLNELSRAPAALGRCSFSIAAQRNVSTENGTSSHGKLRARQQRESLDHRFGQHECPDSSKPQRPGIGRTGTGHADARCLRRQPAMRGRAEPHRFEQYARMADHDARGADCPSGEDPFFQRLFGMPHLSGGSSPTDGRPRTPARPHAGRGTAGRLRTPSSNAPGTITMPSRHPSDH